MYVNNEKFNNLLIEMSEIRAKLELYEKYEKTREKEFRELERYVYKLKNDCVTELREQLRPVHRPLDYDGATGAAWLR